MRQCLCALLACAVCSPSCHAAVVISEIFYNLSGSESATTEWVEITNTGASSIDLSGWTYGDSQDNQYANPFPVGTMIAAGQSAVLVEQDATVFRSIWGEGINVINISPGVSLSNSASGSNEEVSLTDAVGMFADYVNFGNGFDGRGWPTGANGASIYLLPGGYDTDAGNRDGSSWATSTVGVHGAYEALTLNPSISNASARDIASPGYADTQLFTSPVIDVPPSVIPGGTTVPNNTTINIAENGIVGDQVFLGATDGTGVGVVANMTGGAVGQQFRVQQGAVFNISGGTVGGSWGAGTESAGGEINVSGGYLETFGFIRDGAVLHQSGGTIGRRLQIRGGTAVIEGGVIADDFEFQQPFGEGATSVTVRGAEFYVNGAPLAGLVNVGDTLQVDPQGGITGVLADGTPFAFGGGAGEGIIDDGVLTLELVAVDTPAPATLNLPADPAPQSIRGQQTLNVGTASLGENFMAGRGSTVTIQGGSVGRNFEAIGATVNLEGGSIEREFLAIDGTVVNVSGGTILPTATASYNSQVNVSGGEVRVDVLATAAITISGGTTDASVQGTATVSGGVANLDMNSGTATLTGGTTTLTGVGTVVNNGGTIAAGSNLSLSTITMTDGLVEEGFVLRRTSPNGSPKFHLYGGALQDDAEIGDGAELIVDGGTVANNLTAKNGATVTVLQGAIGDDFAVRNDLNPGFSRLEAVVNVNGGSIGDRFRAVGGATVSLNAGVIGDDASIESGSLLSINGGVIGANLTVNQGEVAVNSGEIGVNALVMSGGLLTLNGGAVGANLTADQGQVVVRGGTIGADVEVAASSGFNLIGSHFAINGEPLAGPQVARAFTVDQRDATLSGLLLDGTPFEFDLNSAEGLGDYFSPQATLTVTQRPEATTVSFSNEMPEYDGVRDTLLSEATPDTPTDPLASPIATLRIVDSPSGDAALSLVRFEDIIGADASQVPASGKIIEATLQVNIYDAGSGFRVYRLATDWDDNTATWNNLGSSGDGVNLEEDVAGELIAEFSGAHPDGFLASVDVSAAVQAWADGEPNFGLALVPIPGRVNEVLIDSSEIIETGFFGIGPRLSVSYVMATIAGDFNGDGVVDAADYTLWRDNVGGFEAEFAVGSGNDDAIVDQEDYALWAANFGATLATEPEPAGVPEPEAALLAALALGPAARRPRWPR